MPTVGIVNGTNLRAYSGATAIGNATTSTLSISRELREILTKDSPGSGWREILPGRKSGTLTVEALYSEDTSNVAPDTLFTALDNGTRLFMKLSTTVSGDNQFVFYAYCVSFEVNQPVEENVSYSCTFEVDGAITQVTVT